MPNLLPENNKKEILNEFILRLIIVFFALSFVVICIAVVLLIPSYILSQVKETGATDEIKIFRETIEFREMDSRVGLLELERVKIDVLKKRDRFDISEMITIITDKKTEDIRITGIFYEINLGSRGEENKAQLVVNGIADKRSALINFVNRLEQEDNFSEIDFPVSNLVKDVSVDFSINISVNDKDI